MKQKISNDKKTKCTTGNARNDDKVGLEGGGAEQAADGGEGGSGCFGG